MPKEVKVPAKWQQSRGVDSFLFFFEYVDQELQDMWCEQMTGVWVVTHSHSTNLYGQISTFRKKGWKGSQCESHKNDGLSGLRYVSTPLIVSFHHLKRFVSTTIVEYG